MTEPAGSSVGAALRQAERVGVARLDAQRLLADLLQRPRTWLMAHDDALLDAQQVGRWQRLLERCQSGEPLAYLLGHHEFFGLSLQVGPQVLVPRADTETLVAWALERLDALQLAGPGTPRVVDLGTGSGAIALAVKQQHARAEVWAVDASPDALAVARGNGRSLGLTVHWLEGDWWSGLADSRFDLVLSNPPYIAEGDPHLAALVHEPALALSSGPDGLSALRQIIAEAPQHLHPGGWLLLEHGYQQAAAVAALLSQAGFDSIQGRHDLAGHLRCTGGQWRNGPKNHLSSGQAAPPDQG